MDMQPAPGGGNGLVINGMLSAKGESLPFFEAVPLHGTLEVWMAKVDAEMRLTVQNRSKQVCIAMQGIEPSCLLAVFLGVQAVVHAQTGC